MKKFLVVGLVVVLGAGVTFAATLNVPFFNDNTSNLSGGVPATGSAGFVGIKNITGATIVARVNYTSFPGGDIEQQTTATFEIQPFAAFSFRPNATDGAEGVGSMVENMTSGVNAGSLSVEWDFGDYLGGSAADLQGRYVEIKASGDIFGYLLPAGVGGS